MIYRLENEFNGDELEEFLKKISTKFVIMYIQGTLYLTLINIENKEESIDFLKELLSFFPDHELVEIDSNNLKYEAPVIQDWCRDHFVRLETQLYELNEQERLQQIWSNMDKMEEILKNKNKKGGK